MKTTLLVFGLTCCAVLSAVASDPVTRVSGRVYIDANGNGTMDAGESPASGVRLTDGRHIVISDESGKYQLEVGPDHMLKVPGTQVVALCWPSGKWPTSKHWFRLKDITDPTHCDFGLREVEQKLPFTYLHVSDNHDWRASQYENQHENASTTWREAAFIINTGDIAFGGATPEGMDESGARLLKCMGLNPMPTFATIGNHDTDSNFGPDHEYSFCGGFAKTFGPLRWSFDYAGIRFTFIDVIEDNAALVDPTAEWLERDLASISKGGRVILSYHYPRPESSRKFMDILRRHPVELIHAGHTHSYARYRDRWPAPMITAFARSSGTANMIRVDSNVPRIAVFCDGCARGAHNYAHSRRCPVNWRTHFIESLLEARTAKTHEAHDMDLATAMKEFPLDASSVYVTAEIKSSADVRTGIRINQRGEKPIEVSRLGNHLTIDGSRFPTRIPPNDDGILRLQVFAHHDMLTVWANDVFFFEEEIRFMGTSGVTAFCEGGPASLVSFKVAEIMPDPDNADSGYFCACGHGGIMRNREPQGRE